MQKTDHLHLSTWAEDDPVSLEEMNENFELLDGDAASKTQKLGKHDAALKTLALHTAQRALESYHSGLIGEVQDNLILADFSKHDDWSAVHNVRLEETSVQNSAGTYLGSDHPITKMHVRKDEWSVLDSFEALENGNISRIEMSVTTNGGYSTTPCASIRIKDGDTVIAEYTDVYNANMPVFESCPIIVGHVYTIEASTWQSNFLVGFEGRCKVFVTPDSFESGYVISKEFALQGSKVYFWITATGDAPDISILDPEDHTVPLTAEETADITDLYGNSAKRYFYKAESCPWQNVRIKADITGSTSIPYLCGMCI